MNEGVSSPPQKPYNHVFDLMDEALERDRGLEIECESDGKAVRLRHRMNAARARHRRREAHQLGADPQGHHTAYDSLVFRIPKSRPTVIQLLHTESVYGMSFRVRDPATGELLGEETSD